MEKKNTWEFKEEKCVHYLNKFIEELKNKNVVGMKKVLDEMAKEDCIFDYKAKEIRERIDRGEHITKPLRIEYELIENIVDVIKEKYALYPEDEYVFYG
jgi:hypothetical protein